MTNDVLYRATNQNTFDSVLYSKNKPLSGRSLLLGSFLQNTKHKVFISYRHKNVLYNTEDDQLYKEVLVKAGENVFIDKSVETGDINPNNQDEYIKRLIQKNHLDDTTVLIVLIGAETHSRKHIDWEISAALDYRVGDKQAALIGIVLPNHPYYNQRHLHPVMPQRLYDNYVSGYASVYYWDSWIYDSNELSKAVETAFLNRGPNKKLINNTLTQFSRNRPLF